MRAQLEQLKGGLDAMSREELISFISHLIEELSEKEAMLEVTGEATTQMSLDYGKLKNENAALKKENKELLRQNRSLTQQLQMRKKDLYGRKSEHASGLADAIQDGVPTDPLAEEQTEEEAAQETTPETLEKKTIVEALKETLRGGGEGKRGKKKPGKRSTDLDSLPTRTFYDLDTRDLDQRYGEGNWRIAFWRQEDTVESVHTVQYHKRTFRPVISTGQEHELVSPYPCGKILPGSLATSSLAAEVMYQKIVQCVPSFRMEADFIRSGIPLSRQTVTNWINRFSLDILAIASDYMGTLLVRRDHNQCDETPYEVIRDNRKAGTKSYMWVHTTSELDPGHPIIVFRYELTRATQHLRDFYGEAGFSGNITSDAYCSYETLEKEYPNIKGSRCLMHVRRRFYYASLLVDVKGQEADTVRALPEIKALKMLDAVNDAERPLKGLPAQERLQIRQTIGKEKVDAFYDYIKTLDVEDPSYSEKLTDAIRYALNQEEKFRRFLEDPMIPIDNGFCERSLKGFASYRRSCLFSTSVEGAEAAAILFTLVETAKANQAHPYYYLKYLLEKLSRAKVTKGSTLLDECMPWSEAYRAYEECEKQVTLQFFADQCPPVRPRTVHKRDKSA